MKKPFLLLLFSLFILLSWGQDLNKIKNTISLDGKSYKITLKTSAVQEKNPSQAKSSSSDKTISQSKKTEFAVIEKSQKTDDVEIINGAEIYDTSIIVSDKKDILILGQSDDLDIESFSNTTMLLSFENGLIHSSIIKYMDEEDCSYTLTKTVSGSLTFTAECYNIESKINSGSKWNGTIDGKSIKGNLYLMTEKGENFLYVFTGSELKDSSKELGLR